MVENFNDKKGNAPIIEKLTEIAENSPTAFHMPGHKRKRKFVPQDLFSFDITEIDGVDNIHNPTGIIKESQQLCANLFGADKSFFLVNGTTSGVMASILATCLPNDKIIVARNCHKSVYNGLILSGANPIYVMPEETFFGTSGTISLQSVNEILQEHDDIKAMIITSPTYEGLCSNISEIAEVLHEKDIPLIVDEAHASHFAFSDDFPKTALESGADIVIQSLHKTLPVLTQTSILHLKSSIIDENRLSATISMLLSTSPSYIFMAVIDNCQKILSQQADILFGEYSQNLNMFYQNTKSLKNITVLTKNEVLKNSNAFDFDFGKIILLTDKKNLIIVENYLKKYYNINIEMKGVSHLLLMTSFCDEKEDFLKLIKALTEIDRKLSEGRFIEFQKSKNNDRPVVAISPAKAFNSKTETVDFQYSIGLVSGEFIIPYPPGIPIVAPGEVITNKIVQTVKSFQDAKVEIIGTKDKDLNSIQVII